MDILTVRRTCIYAVDSMLPKIYEHIGALHDGKITHVLGDFSGKHEFTKIKLIKMKDFPVSNYGLYCILLFQDCAVEGYITFLDERLTYDLKVLAPHENTSERYKQILKLF